MGGNTEEGAKKSPETQQQQNTSPSSNSKPVSSEDSSQSGTKTTSNTRTTCQSRIRVQRPQVQAVTEASEGGGGYVMYDVLIMVLVAAIATLLYRRINLMGAE